DLVDAEEHMQNAEVRTVVAEMAGRMLGVRRPDQRRPARVGLSRRVAVLRRPDDGRPGSPEVPVVLVVPGFDRGVRRGQVLGMVEANSLIQNPAYSPPSAHLLYPKTASCGRQIPAPA